MNLDNLTVGEIYKSYKALCEVLEVNATGGNVKKERMEEIERFYQIEKIGYKLKVVKRYDEPLPKTIRSERQAYLNKLDELLLSVLYPEEEDGRVWTRSQLYRELFLHNKHYFEYAFDNYNAYKRLALVLGVSESVVEDFFKSTNSEFRYLLNSRLDKLTGKSLLIYDKITMVKEVDASYCIDDVTGKIIPSRLIKLKEEYNTYDQKRIYINQIDRPATDYEKDVIMQSSYEIMDELGCKSISEVIYKGYGQQYSHKLNEKLLIRIGVMSHYEGLIIRVNRDAIEKERILEKNAKLRRQREINKGMLANGYKKIVNRHSRALEGKGKESRVDIRSDESYPVDSVKVMSSMLNKEYDNMEKVNINDELYKEMTRLEKLLDLKNRNGYLVTMFEDSEE